MAKYINSSGSLHLNIYIEQVSQDIANNSSRVSWKATVDRDGAYRTYTYGNISSLSVWLNGSSVHSSNPDFDTSGEEVTLASGEVTIPHNGDGTKTFSVWASFDPNNGVHGNITVSANYTLSSIPRSSSVSDNALSGNRQLGSLHTLTIDRKSNSFTHQVWYRVFGSDWIDLGKNHATSVSFIPNLDLARYNKKAKSGTMDICVRTYNGTTQIGNDVYSNGWYFEIPESVKPTFSGLTLIDMNTVARQLLNGNNFLQIISDIQVNFNNPSGAYGSTITGYRAEIVNKNQVTTVNGGRLGMMNFNGSATIRASVIDSRGRQSDARDITINVIEYFAPALSFSIARTGSTSSTLTVTRNAKIAPLTVSGSQKNTMTLTFKAARLGTTNFQVDTGPATGSWTSISNLVNSQANLAGNYLANQSWMVIGVLEDKFTRTEFMFNVPTESVVLSYDRSGIGVNKIRERGALDVKGDIFANDQPIQQYQLTQNNGKVLNADRDWNDYINSGLYMGSNLQNAPQGGSSWKHVQVFKHNDNWVVQVAYDFDGGVTSVRTKTNGNWNPWKYLATKDDVQKYTQGTTWQNLTLQNGWQHHPDFARVQYSKSFDGIVYLRGTAFKGRTTPETVIGTLPAGFRPSESIYVTGINNSFTGAVLAVLKEGGIVVKANVDATWLNFDNISFKI
ncbi:capsid and scaffold protein [Streptococcus phage Javan350]|nr:structural protein [Streptococcus oralis subsp. tigurinus AZ_3a]QBX26908.1 capsid and scaffold protein [Streptococcus phage Javan350]